MGQKSVSVGHAPNVTITAVHGNLQVKGWDREEVLLRSTSSDADVLDTQDNNVQISCEGDCIVRLPHDAIIYTDTVHGNARFILLEGELRIDRVFGSLEARNITSARIGNVSGNLVAKQVTEELYVEQVQGSAIARDIQGACTLKQVGGNLDLRDAENDIQASAGGNVRVRLCLLVGQSYSIRAGGNLSCIVPQDASLGVDLTSEARRIQIKQPDSKTTLAEQKHHLAMGEEEITMSLMSGGTILFACQEADWAEMDDIQEELDEAFTEFSEQFGQQIADQVEQQIEAQMEILNEQLSRLESMVGQAGLSEAKAEQVMQRARQASEKATERAQERMRRAQEKLDRKLQAAQRKAEIKIKAAERRNQPSKRSSWRFDISTPPAPPAAPAAAEAATEEERLLILHMLEQKRITIQEAEDLLAALETK